MGNNTLEGESLVQHANGRQIYPEVAEYFRIYRQVERTYQRAVGEADRAYNDAIQDLRWEAEDAGRTFDTYGNQTDRSRSNELARARDAAYAAAGETKTQQGQALRELLTGSPHREVKWIAENCLFAGNSNEVREYARNILAILPATTEEIWEEAKDNRGMCEVFDRYYEQAEAAGIFNGGHPEPGHRERIAYRNYIRRNYGQSYVRDMDTHVDRIIKAITEHYEAEMAKAKAEWQGLDEAWRSERSRRAAATRAERTAVAVQQAREALAEADAHAEATMDRLSEEVRQENEAAKVPNTSESLTSRLANVSATT